MPVPHRFMALRRPPRHWPTARRFYNAPVAQPDRVVASEAIGRGFESLRARHLLVGFGLPITGQIRPRMSPFSVYESRRAQNVILYSSSIWIE